MHQKHTHSRTCRKYINIQCNFNFGRLLFLADGTVKSNETYIIMGVQSLRKFFEIACRTTCNRLNFLLFLNTRVSTFYGILLGSRQRSFCRRVQVGHFRFNFYPVTLALNLSRRGRQPTNNIDSTPPMIYTVSFTDKMLEFKLKIYGRLYDCLPSNELDKKLNQHSSFNMCTSVKILVSLQVC